MVAGADGAHAGRLVALLGRSAHVGTVDRATDEVALGNVLAARHADLVVLVLGAPDRPLPRCLLHHPSTRVLVVAPDGVAGTLSRWLQQGANDLVSPHDDDALAHALGRMVDECALAAKARRLEARLAASPGSVEASDVERARPDAANASRADAPDVLPVDFPHDDALEETDADAAPDDLPDSCELDPATRLPTRAATITALRKLRSRHAGDPAACARLTALQVTLPGGDPHAPLDRTLADIAACRAADVLRRALPPMLVFGRTRHDTLLVVLAGAPETLGGTGAAGRLLAACGSLGELVERAGDLRIDALDGTVRSIATATLPERMERRAHDAFVAGAAGAALRATRLTFGSATSFAAARREPAARDVPVVPTGDEPRDGTRAATRYIGAAIGAPTPVPDDGPVPVSVPTLRRKRAGARFARPVAGA